LRPLILLLLLQLTVIDPPARRVAQRLVRFVELPGSGTGFCRARVNIRMMPLRQYPVSGSDLLQRAAAIQPQRGVMILRFSFQAENCWDFALVETR